MANGQYWQTEPSALTPDLLMTSVLATGVRVATAAGNNVRFVLTFFKHIPMVGGIDECF